MSKSAKPTAGGNPRKIASAVSTVELMFPVGATVQLRSGGHLMTVVGYRDRSSVEVVWSRFEDVHRSEFFAGCLREVGDAPRPPDTSDVDVPF